MRSPSPAWLLFCLCATALGAGHEPRGKSLKTPRPRKVSDAQGKKLFEAKCLPCHDPGKGPYVLKVFANAIGQPEGEPGGYSDMTEIALDDVKRETMPKTDSEGKITLDPGERAELTEWLEGKQAHRASLLAEAKRRFLGRTRKDALTVRYRTFGNPKLREGKLIQFLTAEEFGEPALELEEGGASIKVTLSRIETLQDR